MSEIVLFLKTGWKLLWKNPLLLLLGLIYSGSSLSIDLGSKNPIFLLCCPFFDLIIIFLSSFAILYVSYCLSTEIKYSLPDGLRSFKKTWPRLAGMSCLLGIIVFIITFPFVMGSVLFGSAIGNSAVEITRLPVLLIFTVIETLFNFAMLGVIGMDYGIAESIKKDVSIFIRHFWILFGIGMIFSIVQWCVNLILASSLLLVQSKFNFSALSDLDFIGPLTNLQNTPLYFVNSIFSIIWTPYLLLVLTLAYIKFNEVKVSAVVEKIAV